MDIIRQTPKLWAVYHDGRILVEDLSLDQLVDYLMAEYRQTLVNKLQAHNCVMTWEQAQVLSGRIVCCDCGEKADRYNPSWPLERQRCTSCLSK